MESVNVKKVSQELIAVKNHAQVSVLLTGNVLMEYAIVNQDFLGKHAKKKIVLIIALTMEFVKRTINVNVS
jgi:hypothetical protein